MYVCSVRDYREGIHWMKEGRSEDNVTAEKSKTKKTQTQKWTDQGLPGLLQYNMGLRGFFDRHTFLFLSAPIKNKESNVKKKLAMIIVRTHARTHEPHIVTLSFVPYHHTHQVVLRKWDELHDVPGCLRARGVFQHLPIPVQCSHVLPTTTTKKME